MKLEALWAALAVARQAAEEAGALIRSRWNTPVQIHQKGAVDLVTEVDLAAEAIILRLLREAFPGDQLIAEESAERRPGERTWYIDPLDGTTNFSHGFPHFAVSIALVDGEGPAVGVVHQPLTGWTFHAVRGSGAWRDGQRLGVTDRTTLDLALLATGFPYDRRTRTDDPFAEAAWLLRRCGGLRRAGAASLDLAYVAAGWLDAYWENTLSAWDVAAGALLVREAGGTVSGSTGEAFDLAAGHIAASNGPLHAPLLAELRAARQSATSSAP